VGEDVESILYKLYQSANYDLAATQVGIVYVDEVRGRGAYCVDWSCVVWAVWFGLCGLGCVGGVGTLFPCVRWAGVLVVCGAAAWEQDSAGVLRGSSPYW
jgi:hypothetical protein